MDFYDTYRRLGGEPTVTFGCGRPAEIVGPLKPRSVQYGITYGNDGEDVFGRPFPTVWMNFNKYRPDLPPWEKVVEFVLAAENDGETVEYTFIDTDAVGVDTTGDLKTVNVVADSMVEGVEAAAVVARDEVARSRSDRAIESEPGSDEVAEKRGMDTGVDDGSTFKVTEELR